MKNNIVKIFLVSGIVFSLSFFTPGLIQNIFAAQEENPVQLDTGSADQLLAEENAKLKLFYPDPFYDLRSVIGSTLRSHIEGLSFVDIEKLDFSKPEQQGYDDDIKFEVFNPKGPFKFPLIDGDVISPDRMNEIATKKTEILYVLYRRAEDTGATQDELWAVIPNIKDSVCQKHNPHMIEGTLDLTPHSQGPVPLPKGFPKLVALDDLAMCIGDSSKINYQFEMIGSRQKAKNSDVWE